MKIPKNVEHWDDERAEGNGIIVSMKAGRAFVPDTSSRSAEHVRGFDTPKEALVGVKSTSRCPCDDCAK